MKYYRITFSVFPRKGGKEYRTRIVQGYASWDAEKKIAKRAGKMMGLFIDTEEMPADYKPPKLLQL